MKEFEQHEKFEMEVLSQLHRHNLLSNLVFGGGTMLRLCHELNRYSIDLDFYFKNRETDRVFNQQIKELIDSQYELTDYKDKKNTLLLECRSSRYPMRLKIEFNKNKLYPISRKIIAYSRFSTLQVILDTIPLDLMMLNKCEALVSRKEVRDAFDIEFLIQRGIDLPKEFESFPKMIHILKSFKPNDFAVKLGSLLPDETRRYYKESGFAILMRHLGDLESTSRDGKSTLG